MQHTDQRLIGWREWIALPGLNIHRVKAKIDTGARTSALHAFSLQPFVENGKKRIRFEIHPLQHDTTTVVICEADVVEQRWVTDSGGHRELRYVIVTELTMAGITWPIEVTLTERETMLFRVLLGRSALHNRFVIDPAQSFLTKRRKKKSKKGVLS